MKQSVMLLGAGNPASSKLRRREVLSAAMLLLALALAYYVGVQIGFAFTLEPNAVSLLWPPNAILLAAMLLAPPRAWVWLALAVLPAHFVAELSAGVPLVMVLCWYVSNLTEAMLGAAIVRKVLGDTPQFDRVRDVSVFLLAGVLIAPVLSSLLDAGFVALAGWRYDDDYWRVFRMRLFSNALAAMTAAPFLIITLRGRWVQMRRANWALYVEAAALLALLCVVSVVVFHQSHSAGEAAVYVYAPLPLLVWAAVRTGVGGVSVCLTTLALLAITGTLRGTGPFSAAGPETSVLALQIFLIITASSLMLLAAALSELRRARTSAVTREESLDLALSAAQMGAWEWNLATDAVTWRLGSAHSTMNSRLPESAAEVLARVHHDDRELMEAAMTAARERGEADEVECRFVCDRDVRWIRALGKVQCDAEGVPRRVSGVCIDTTQRRAQETHERSQRAQLAHLSRAATLGELSGALAHELSQPLAAILINAQAAKAELFRPTPDLDEIAAILNDIAADDQRAGEVIRRLRALFVRGVVQMERVDVGECIRSVLGLEHSDLIARNVATELRIDQDLPAVAADRVQLQQVLLNLIVNACDAMAGKDGDRRLRIAASCERGEVRIEVADNGAGVADLERVFEPFYSTKTQGIGLGLTISRTIIGVHGGRLWGANNPGGGATFHVALPAAAVECDGNDATAAAATPRRCTREGMRAGAPSRRR